MLRWYSFLLEIEHHHRMRKDSSEDNHNIGSYPSPPGATWLSADHIAPRERRVIQLHRIHCLHHGMPRAWDKAGTLLRRSYLSWCTTYGLKIVMAQMCRLQFRRWTESSKFYSAKRKNVFSNFDLHDIGIGTFSRWITRKSFPFSKEVVWVCRYFSAINQR